MHGFCSGDIKCKIIDMHVGANKKKNRKTLNLKSLNPVFCQPHPSLTFIHFETLTPFSSDSLGCHGNEVAQNDRLIFNLHNNPFSMGTMFPGNLRQQLLCSHFNYDDLLIHPANLQWKVFSLSYGSLSNPLTLRRS